MLHLCSSWVFFCSFVFLFFVFFCFLMIFLSFSFHAFHNSQRKRTELSARLFVQKKKQKERERRQKKRKRRRQRKRQLQRRHHRTSQEEAGQRRSNTASLVLGRSSHIRKGLTHTDRFSSATGHSVRSCRGPAPSTAAMTVDTLWQ